MNYLLFYMDYLIKPKEGKDNEIAVYFSQVTG